MFFSPAVSKVKDSALGFLKANIHGFKNPDFVVLTFSPAKTTTLIKA